MWIVISRIAGKDYFYRGHSSAPEWTDKRPMARLYETEQAAADDLALCSASTSYFRNVAVIQEEI